MRRGIVALMCVGTLGGCATTYAVAPQATVGQGIRYDKGSPTVMSVQAHSAVRVSPAAKQFTDKLALNVAAFNNGPGAANLGYENILVATSDGRSLRLFTYDDLQREAKTRAAWAAFAVALAGAADAYAAQQSAYSHGAATSTTYTPYGSIYSSYNYSAYNPALANALTRRAADDTTRGIAQIENELDRTVATLDARVLQTTTVDVGQIVGGVLVLEKPKFQKGALTQFIVRVSFNGDVHEFRFSAGDQSQIAQLPIAGVTPATTFGPTRVEVAQPSPSAPINVSHPTNDRATSATPTSTKEPPAKGCGVIRQRNGSSRLVLC